jgi:hypothetical protein
MDPWLEHPAIWPDVHNRLVAAMADALSPQLAPKYYVSLEERMTVTEPSDAPPPRRPDLTGAVVFEFDAPETLVDWYLVIRQSADDRIVTVVELLSRANKSDSRGRHKYLRERQRRLRPGVNLVEIDLLRIGRPTHDFGWHGFSHYRTVIRRGHRPRRAVAYLYGAPQPIPPVPIPLLVEDPEPVLDLNVLLAQVYDRARYDLRIDYALPPVPPLDIAVDAWASGVIAARAANGPG